MLANISVLCFIIVAQDCRNTKILNLPGISEQTENSLVQALVYLSKKKKKKKKIIEFMLPHNCSKSDDHLGTL